MLFRATIPTDIVAMQVNKISQRHALLLLYLMILGWVLFFINTQPFSRLSTDFQKVAPQLIPFKSIFQYFKAVRIENKTNASLTNVLGNIVLFIPWGFLIAQTFIFLRNWLLVSLSSLILSLLAEVIQYTFHVGVFDVDDIILNTIGGILGYGVFLIWVRYSAALSKK